MDFSRTEAALIASNDREVSMSFFFGALVTWLLSSVRVRLLRLSGYVGGPPRFQ